MTWAATRRSLSGRRLAGCLALVVLAAGPATWAAGPLPQTLKQPRDGTSVELRAGAAALHVVFFATWCPPCVDELTELADLEDRWRDRGYQLVLVAVQHRQSVARLAGFVEQRRPPGRLLFDASGQAESAFGADHLPTHIVLDAAGREVARAEHLDDTVEQVIEQLLRRPSPRGRQP